MIFGERIALRVTQSAARDEFGNERAEYGSAQTVSNVLVAPSSSQDFGGGAPGR